MTEMIWELFVVGLLLYGLALLGLAAVRRPAGVWHGEPGEQDAPIFVRRRSTHEPPSVARRTGTTRTTR